MYLIFFLLLFPPLTYFVPPFVLLSPVAFKPTHALQIVLTEFSFFASFLTCVAFAGLPILPAGLTTLCTFLNWHQCSRQLIDAVAEPAAKAFMPMTKVVGVPSM